MNPFKLWSFHGGLRLEGHKQDSARLPLRTAALPERLIYPLPQRDGTLADAVVAVGDPVLKGQAIARDPLDLHPPTHAASSGRVAAIESLPLPHPSGLSGPCLVIETDGEDAVVESEGLADYLGQPPEELRRRIHAAGIVGLGGAAFPTAQKLAAQARPIATLILNGAECEPYIACDDSLLRHRAAAVLAGAAMLRHILGAGRTLLAIENDRPEALAAVRLAQGEKSFDGIQIVPVPAIYPTGGERQLIQTLTGREVPSRGLPADIGVACLNVGTAAAVYDAIIHGQPLISRIVTMTGRGIRQPQNFLARIGTPIADLIAQAGGYAPDAERLIQGGPMMGYALPRDDLPITKAANCLLVAGRGEFPAERRVRPCIRCGACAEVCPASLLPQQLYWHSRSGQMERAAEYHLSACIECGCCDLVCPSQIPLAQTFRAAKGKAAARQRELEQAEHARRRYEAREARKAREQQERAAAAQRRKAHLEKASAPAIQEALERAKQKRLQRAKDDPGSPTRSK
jgi:electron transport complex protein RnfC